MPGGLGGVRRLGAHPDHGGKTERGKQRPAAEERLSRNVLPRGLLDDVVAAMGKTYYKNNEHKKREKKHRGWPISAS